MGWALLLSPLWAPNEKRKINIFKCWYFQRLAQTSTVQAALLHTIFLLRPHRMCCSKLWEQLRTHKAVTQKKSSGVRGWWQKPLPSPSAPPRHHPQGRRLHVPVTIPPASLSRSPLPSAWRALGRARGVARC